MREYDSVGIQVLLANPPTPLCEALNRYGFFQRYSSERLFPSVAIAVRYTQDGNRVVRIEASVSLFPLPSSYHILLLCITVKLFLLSLLNLSYLPPQPDLEQPSEPDTTLASNLERQLLYSNRPSLFQTKFVSLRIYINCHITLRALLCILAYTTCWEFSVGFPLSNPISSSLSILY